ncbi:helix-turn-helix domain-containing protein [Streptomyces sp. SID4985]|uniref:helix-turn-helix domain-containing protein n=1 Tax=Streptomyces sp. SID4985 TaxID=2690292 RepID=UPI00136C5B27|nr:helix-turn-helix transcriptional regulator [Streptomyces sp. SID4985]MYQ48131.1 helix-turn-helix domain-containing protein [Streptomyces sp. SID4985]
MNDRERRAEFGAHLADLRKRAGLSQTKLATRLCLASGTTTLTRNEVSRWERGERIPDAWLPSLAEVLEEPLANLRQAAAVAQGAPLPVTRPEGEDDSPHAEVQRLAGWLLVHDNDHGGDHVADAALQVWRAAMARINGDDKFALSVAAELAEVAGWLLFDANRQDEARACFMETLHLARLARNRPMEWFALDLLAMHGIENGRVGEVLSVCDELDSQPVPPRVALLAAVRRSRALALAGDRARATKAIKRARGALEDSLHPRDPRWAWWVDDEEISGQEGEVFLALTDQTRAVPYFERTNKLVTGGNATGRNAFFYRTAELTALATAGAWREAETSLHHLPPILNTVASARTRHRLTKTLRVIERDAPGWLADTAREVTATR